MHDDLEHVIREIHSQRFTVEEKCEKMKEFVEASFGKFKRKVLRWLCRIRSW